MDNENSRPTYPQNYQNTSTPACPKCGKPLPADYPFCPFCGSFIRGSQPREPEMPKKPPIAAVYAAPSYFNHGIAEVYAAPPVKKPKVKLLNRIFKRKR